MKRMTWLALALMLGISQTAGAAIYKWKDKDGAMRYSDTPPPAGTTYETLGAQRQKSTAAPAASASEAPIKSPQEQQDAENEPAESPEALQEKQRVEAENKKIRAQNCATARANLQTFTQGGRISRMNENGEREYLDDEALAKGAEQARKDIAEYCD